MFTDDNFLVLLVIFDLCYWTPGYSISGYRVTSGIIVAMIVVFAPGCFLLVFLLWFVG